MADDMMGSVRRLDLHSPPLITELWLLLMAHFLPIYVRHYGCNFYVRAMRDRILGYFRDRSRRLRDEYANLPEFRWDMQWGMRYINVITFVLDSGYCSGNP